MKLRKPKLEPVCDMCKTAQRRLVPTIEYTSYGEETKFSCLSCLGKEAITAFLRKNDIEIRYLAPNTFIENLRFLAKTNLENAIKRVRS